MGKNLHQLTVVIFWHFIIVYLLYVCRTYLKVGHLPFWKHPVYYELTDISIWWKIHSIWIQVAYLPLFLASFLWIPLTLIKGWNILRKKEFRFKLSLSWDLFGFLGITICYWLVYISSFGFHQWFFD